MMGESVWEGRTYIHDVVGLELVGGGVIILVRRGVIVVAVMGEYSGGVFWSCCGYGGRKLRLS